MPYTEITLSADLAERLRPTELPRTPHHVTIRRSLATFNGAQDALNNVDLHGYPVADALGHRISSSAFPAGDWR